MLQKPEIYQDGWMDISSAPKDGSFILVAAHDGEVSKAAWMRDVGVTGKGPLDWCIADSYQDEQGGFFTVDFPILWMPLPIVPKQLLKK